MYMNKLKEMLSFIKNNGHQEEGFEPAFSFAKMAKLGEEKINEIYDIYQEDLGSQKDFKAECIVDALDTAVAEM